MPRCTYRMMEVFFSSLHVDRRTCIDNLPRFVFGSDDHIVRADVIDCQTDREALSVAPSIGGDHKAVEVWELVRCVGRVDPPHAGDGEQVADQLSVASRDGASLSNSMAMES